MNRIDDGKYNLALSVLNAVIVLCFADVRAEQAKPSADVDAARRLQARFTDYYAQRALLAGADGAALQAVIDDIGSRVRGRVLPC